MIPDSFDVTLLRDPFNIYCQALVDLYFGGPGIRANPKRSMLEKDQIKTGFTYNTSLASSRNIIAALNNTGNYRRNGLEYPPSSAPMIIMNYIPVHFYLIITLVFGGLALLLANVFIRVRMKVYQEQNNVDRAFDAGRKVTFSLIVSLLVSNWTWAATLLQSTTVTVKYGVSGAFWYAAGACVQLILFSNLALQFKIIAPGAKTFVQVIGVRFGPYCHILYCGFALLTNTLVTGMLMLGGFQATKSLISDIGVVGFCLLMIIIMGSYTFVGGLGATIYVSYINASLIFIIILYVSHVIYARGMATPLGGIRQMYKYLYCLQGPSENYHESLLTLLSLPGLQFGIINVIGNFGAVFIDQSYWNCAVACKPRNAVLGFVLGGLLWFAIPFTLATAAGLCYRSLEFRAGKRFLSDQDIDRGLVLPLVFTYILGPKGAFLLYLLLLMAITSTGASNILAVSSIITYDIFQTYLKPFRRTNDNNSCLLCGKQRGRKSSARDKCVCVSKTHCTDCTTDDSNIESLRERNRNKNTGMISPIVFKCKVHGPYRTYYLDMENRRSWITLFVAFSILPLTYFLNAVQINLNWLYNVMGILIGSAIFPICFSLFWSQVTALAVFCSGTLGCIFGLLTWLLVTWSEYSEDVKQQSSHFSSNSSSSIGRPHSFFQHSSEIFPMFLGNVVSISVGCFLTIVITLAQRFKVIEINWIWIFWDCCCKGRQKFRRSNTLRSRALQKSLTKDESIEIWENVRDIDNPLSPWVDVYDKDFDLQDCHYLIDRPTLEQVKNKFKRSRRLAIILSCISLSLFLLIIPGLLCILREFTYEAFQAWIYISLAMCWIGAIFVTFIPLSQEIYQFLVHLKRLKQISALSVQDGIRKTTMNSSNV